MKYKEMSDFNALYSAYKKSKQGKGYNHNRLKFELSALDGITQLKYLLRTKKFTVSPYNSFTVYEPKERIIEAGSFKDKIVQHSLCDNVLIPMLKNEFIPTNVAGQIKKGTYYGLDCLRKHMEQAYIKYGYDCWIIKGDIRKYFYNIDHDILKDIVEYFIDDENIGWLCEKFIDSTQNPGLPLGNQVTQVFALLYLSGFDHFVTGELGVSYYGRCTDDFYLIVNTKEYALECLEQIKQFISTLNIELNGKTQLIPFKRGIKYCGFHTYVTYDGKCIVKLLNDKKRHAKKKYRKMLHLVSEGKLSKEKFMESYQSWKNHVSYGNCVKLINKMDEYIKSIMKERSIEMKI